MEAFLLGGILGYLLYLAMGEIVLSILELLTVSIVFAAIMTFASYKFDKMD